MKYFTVSLLMLSSSAFACWNMKAVLSVNNSEVKIDQVINHDQNYSFAKGKYIFNVKIPSEQNLPTNIPVKAGSYLVMVDVLEKEELNLKTVTNGLIVANYGKEAVMIKEDTESKDVTKMKVTLTEI